MLFNLAPALLLSPWSLWCLDQMTITFTGLNPVRRYLQEHKEKLSWGKHFLVHQTVWIILHALPFGKGIQLLGHHAQQVELFCSVCQVDADTLAGGREEDN